MSIFGYYDSSSTSTACFFSATEISTFSLRRCYFKYSSLGCIESVFGSYTNGICCFALSFLRIIGSLFGSYSPLRMSDGGSCSYFVFVPVSIYSPDFESDLLFDCCSRIVLSWMPFLTSMLNFANYA